MSAMPICPNIQPSAHAQLQASAATSTVNAEHPTLNHPSHQWDSPDLTYSVYSVLSANASKSNPQHLQSSGSQPATVPTVASSCVPTVYKMTDDDLPYERRRSSSSTEKFWRRGQRRSDGSISQRRREQNRRAQSRFRAKRRATSQGDVPTRKKPSASVHSKIVELPRTTNVCSTPPHAGRDGGFSMPDPYHSPVSLQSGSSSASSANHSPALNMSHGPWSHSVTVLGSNASACQALPGHPVAAPSNVSWGSQGAFEGASLLSSAFPAPTSTMPPSLGPPPGQCSTVTAFESWTDVSVQKWLGELLQ